MASCWLYQTQQLYHRPFAYFILISLLAGIIAIEILCFDENSHVWIIILEIILLSANIRWGIFYEFPSLSGADAYWHAKMAQQIIGTGFVPSFEETGAKYSIYPIFHLTVAMTQKLTSLSLKDAIFYSIGLNAIISTIFIYLVGEKVASPKVGLLAVLLANISDDLITEGVVNFFPGTMVTCWFMLMLYLVLNEKFELKCRAILIVITCLTIITHQLNTFVAMFSLILLFLGVKVVRTIYHYPQRVRLTITYLLIFFVALFSYWSRPYSPTTMSSFFGGILHEFKNALLTSEFGYEEVVTVAVHFSQGSNALFHLNHLLVLFFTIGGILWWVSSNDNRKLSIALVVTVLYSLVYGIPALGVNMMITGRWIAVFFPLVAILAAVYIIRIVQLARPNYIRISIVFCIITLITFFAITTPYVNKDNPFYAEDRMHRDQFTASEVSAISSLNAVYSGTIRTDGTYCSGVFRQFDINSSIQFFSKGYIGGNGIKEKKDSLIIIRDCIFEETVRVTDPEARWSPRYVVDRGFLERFKSFDYNLVYSNGEVTAYISK